MLMNHGLHAGILQLNGIFTNHSMRTIVFTTVLQIRATLVTSAGCTISIKKKKIDVFDNPLHLMHSLDNEFPEFYKNNATYKYALQICAPINFQSTFEGVNCFLVLPGLT